MTAYHLEKQLSDVAVRIHRLRVLRRQALCWLIVIIPAVLFCLSLPKTGLPLRRESIALLVAGIVGLLLARWKRKVPTWQETARLVEQHNPGLNDVVLTAVRQRLVDSQVSSVLSARVLHEADNIAHISDWRSVASGGQIFKWFAMSFGAFLLLVSSVLAASRLTDIAARAAGTSEGADPAGTSISQSLVNVEPGDTEIERGTALTVVARFEGGAPSHAAVTLEPQSSDIDAASPQDLYLSRELPVTSVRIIPMDETVDAGVFAIRVPSIDGDARYRIIYGNSDAELTDRRHSSDTYHISTYELPRVNQVDAEIQPPEWTRRESTTIEDTVRIAAIEGSRVTLHFHLNKDVTLGSLVAEDGVHLILSPGRQPFTKTATVDAVDDTSWTVDLQDADGRASSDDTRISLRIIPNELPQIRITFPQPDLSVSALQELVSEAEVVDDFGLVDYGIVYSLSGSDATTLSLHVDSQSSVEQAAISYTINLESLRAQPNDLLTWHFFADAHGADGRIQRTLSDLMFADVRRFEEIFRESRQPGGQSGQQQQQGGGQTEELLQIQRQIAIGIWNVQRGMAASGTEASVEEDIGTLLKSQQLAIAQLNEMKEEAAGEQEMLDAIDAAGQHMADVVNELSAFSTATPEPALTDAGVSSQAAFQQLLRLRAAEHEVRQSQSQQGQSSGQQNSAMQQQLDQLELDNDRNRYETKQQTQQEQQTEEQKEQLQVLSRLKELAHRQNLLNERIKQLESELRNATTDEERERIERELKRLRDEQRELLRDVDELQERMNQSSARNQPEQQQMREQVDQARENVREASRAMDDGRLSDALSEGKRAERQFDQLQEDFRRQTSSAFSEAAQDLRQQARELSERQKEIARELAGAPSPSSTESDENSETEPPDRSGPQSLRSDRNNDALKEQLAQQRDDLEKILEQARQLVEQAEDSEPLLSRRLFETLDDVEPREPGRALRAVELLVDRGLHQQAAEPEEAARRAIEELKEGVEAAAEAVLGSEVESLRQAKDTLDDLAEELSEELAVNAEGGGANAESGRQKAENGGLQDPSDPTDQAGASQQAGAPSQQAGKQPSPSQQPGQSQAGQSGQQSILQVGGREGGSSAANGHRPLTGSDFRNWSDRLREVEELLEDNELRQQASRVRDRARSMRAEFRRHGTEPQWELVESELLGEMRNLQKRLAQEIAAAGSDRSMVPIDREPVPEAFNELVQRYYELLGQERLNEQRREPTE